MSLFEFSCTECIFFRLLTPSLKVGRNALDEIIISRECRIAVLSYYTLFNLRMAEVAPVIRDPPLPNPTLLTAKFTFFSLFFITDSLANITPRTVLSLYIIYGLIRIQYFPHYNSQPYYGHKAQYIQNVRR